MRRLTCLALLLTVCFLLCGAALPGSESSRKEAYAYNEECTRLVLDALMTGDKQAILDVMGMDASEDFYNVYRNIAMTIQGNVGYDLVMLKTHTTQEDTLLIHRVDYRVTFSDRRVYGLIVYSVEGMRGLYLFRISEMLEEKAQNLAPAALSAGLTMLTLLSVGFVVWMLVDCIRRPMKKAHKVLWILAILAFAGILLEWSARSLYIGIFAWLPFGYSAISLVGTLWQLRVMLPVGSIVYFFLRKKITAKYLAARQAYYQEKAPLDFTLDDTQ